MNLLILPLPSARKSWTRATASMAPFPITSLHPTIRKGGMSPPSSSSNYKLGSRWKEAGPENSPLPYFSYPSTKTRRNAVPLKSAPVKGAARTIISSSGVEREEATGCEKKKEGRKEGRKRERKKEHPVKCKCDLVYV